jgi:SSS family solute:Na+ symporter
VLAGRVTTALLMAAAASLTFALSTAKEAFDLILSVGAGTGLIYLLRWFWWRVNAWSEVAAMASSFIVAVGFFVAGKMGHPVASHVSLVVTVITTTVAWVTVTFVTRPTDHDALVAFYRLVRPAGPGWSAIRAEAGGGGSPDRLSLSLLGWVLGCVFVYSGLFGVGSYLYARIPQAMAFTVLFGISAIGLIRLFPHLWPSKEAAAR